MSTDVSPALTVVGLSVIKNDSNSPTTTLTSGVSISVRAGEAIAIVGESGSGKSLTARGIMGLLPDGLDGSGAVTIDGHRTDADPRRTESLRGNRVALLMQDPFTMLNPLRTVGRQLADGLTDERATSRRRRRRAVVECLGEVGLDADVADRYPHQLSGGMRQRVGLAAALLGDPAVLIADEPTTALDAATQRDVLELIARLQRDRNLGVVLITHNLGLAFSSCDQVAVMYAGRLVERGPALALHRRPRHPYTAALLASEPALDRRLAEIGGIPGNVPTHDGVGVGCAFADRCRFAIEACRSDAPALAEVALGHVAACIRSAELDLTPVRRAGRADPLAPIGKPPLLAVSELRRSFDRASRPALDGVSLHIAHGQAVAVVGESGSGKTTLARIIVGLEYADSGSVTLEGTDISVWRALDRSTRTLVRRRVQMVFQDPYSSLDPRRTVGSTLREALRSLGLPDASDNAVADLLARVRLPSAYAAAKPRALSGGERQRVAIARALAARPELLIFDEAVSALDVSVQAQILDLLNSLREETGMALLLITHDLAVARQTTDTVYVLRAGRVVESGSTAKILSAPDDDYTRRLIASVPTGKRDWLTGGSTVS